jgi:hypothetical protein
MASVVKDSRNRSPYWIACYTDATGRRLKKSTGLTAKSKAMEMARALQKASDEARRGALTEARTRELLSEVLQSVNGEGLHVFTVTQWFDHFVNQKKKSRAAATGKRHAQTMREFMAFLGPRAKLNIAAITSRDIASFRDHRHSLGLAPATVSIDVAILSAAFNAALRQGHVSVNPCLAIKPLKNKPQRKDPRAHNVRRSQRERAVVPQLEAFVQLDLGERWRQRGTANGADWSQVARHASTLLAPRA